MHHSHQDNIVHDSRHQTMNCHLQAGLDSLGAVDLRNSLSSAFGTDALPATLAFDYPTVAALAQLLLSLQPQAGEPQVCHPHRPSSDSPVSIFMAGSNRLPAAFEFSWKVCIHNSSTAGMCNA
jgi:acyl carrier protein